MFGSIRLTKRARTVLHVWLMPAHAAGDIHAQHLTCDSQALHTALLPDRIRKDCLGTNTHRCIAAVISTSDTTQQLHKRGPGVQAVITRHFCSNNIVRAYRRQKLAIRKWLMFERSWRSIRPTIQNTERPAQWRNGLPCSIVPLSGCLVQHQW